MKSHSGSQLRKNIGPLVAMSLVIGSVIGSGIFMKPGKVIAAAGDSTLALLAWFLGGVITLAGGLTIAELSTRIPKTGGLYVYIEEVYGRFWGYICGWIQTLIYGPAIIGALGLYFATLMVNFFAWPDQWKIPVGIATIVFLAAINSLGTRYGGFLQAASTIGKLVPIALIAIFGLLTGDGTILGQGSGLTEKTGIAAAILATMWAYDGWMLVGMVAGEMKNPARDLPKAIIGGLSLVMAAYLTVNLAMLHQLPADRIVDLGANAASTVATILFGDFGGKLISIGILISIFGCLNGKILAFPRVPFAMAERGQLPASGLVGWVHPTFGTPVWATITQVVLAVLLLFLGDPDRLSDIAMFALLIFTSMGFTAVLMLRKRKPLEPGVYQAPLYPVIPLLAIVGALFIIISTLLSNPLDTLISLAVTAAGIPVYWYLNRKQTP